MLMTALLGVCNFELCTMHFGPGSLFAQKEARITFALKGLQELNK